VATSSVLERPRRARARAATTSPPSASKVETALAQIDQAVFEATVEARPTRRHRVTKVLRLTGGWIIFGVGVVFVILPVIPGTPLVVLAAFILAPDVPMFARVLDWSKTRVSGISTGINDVNQRFADDFHRRFSA
jgi:hypothetical protein